MVKVIIFWALNLQSLGANIKEGSIIQTDGGISVFDQLVEGESGIVRLNNYF
jgi:hypothetical protein